MEKTTDLKGIFPLLTFQDLERDEVESIYNVMNISVFDHILDINEANEKITPALDVANPLNKEYHNKFFHFYAFFYPYIKMSYTALKYDERNDQDIFELKRIDNMKYNQLCESSFSEKELMKILIPTLGCMLCGGFDFTNTIYVNKQYDLSIIKSEVEKHGLFVLE